MALDSFKIKKSLNLEPKATPIVTDEGDVAYDATAHKLVVLDNASTKNIVTETGTATLTNKTITSPVISSPTGLVKGDVGLGNVDNTSDATKNSATATLTNKTLTSPAISSPTGLVKGDVGLGNVDNTSDATKNSAAATLTNKTLNSPVINSPTGIVKGDVGLGNVDNTSDATKNSATATFTNKTISGSSNTITGVSLTTAVTGTLPLANGGTGQTTAANAITALLPSQTGNNTKVLTSNGTTASWQSAGGNPFEFHASSQVASSSSTVTATSFTTFDNSPAFSISPTTSGTYKVYCGIPFEVISAANGAAACRIINTSGSATLLYESQGSSQGNVADTSSVYIQSVYTLSSGNTYVFDLQGLLISGGGASSCAIRGDISSFYMFAERCG